MKEDIIHQLEKSGVTWKDGTKATPSQIEDIIVAIKLREGEKMNSHIENKKLKRQ